MRLLFIQDSLGTGGAERSNANFWYFLKEQDVDIKIIVLEHRNVGIEQEIIDAGFNVYFLKSSHFLSHIREIAHVIKEYQPVLVHSVLFKASIRTRLAKLLVQFTSVESLVNCTYDPIRLSDNRISKIAFYGYKWLDRITAKYLIDYFIPITHTVKKHYKKHLNIPLNKMNVIYRGREENFYYSSKYKLKKEIALEIGANPDNLFVIHVGRQEYQKGHLFLLKSIQILEKKNNLNINLLFLGREGNTSQDIKNYINKKDFNTPIYWLGHRPDVQRFLAASDIFVFPSLYEGLGGALIEAQAAGLPIICSDIPVLREVIVENKNAFLFEVSNEVQLSEKLGKLIKDDEARDRMGAKSIENYKQKFHIENIHNQMLSFYNELLQTSKMNS